MFRSFGAPELILILVIVIILFGAGRIRKIAGELGSGINAFKKGLKESEEDEDLEQDIEEENQDA